MSLFTESEVRTKARSYKQNKGYNYSLESTETAIFDSIKQDDGNKVYDIFLSHSVRDAELILGMKVVLEELGYSVYIDWVDDPQLDRSSVTKDTANKLRERMKRSKSLFYITTENSSYSKWMPWECGYFDGIRDKVAITPILKASHNNEYKGQEYLGLYPYTIKLPTAKSGKDTLWIFKDKNHYMSYDLWVQTPSTELSWKTL